MEYLAQESPVRPSVRKTAYERMRCSRWAPLFGDVPTASAALTSRCVRFPRGPDRFPQGGTASP